MYHHGSYSASVGLFGKISLLPSSGDDLPSTRCIGSTSLIFFVSDHFNSHKREQSHKVSTSTSSPFPLSSLFSNYLSLIFRTSLVLSPLLYNCSTAMGAWGYGLFQSDADLEICDEISSEAAKLAKDATLRLLRPKNRAAVVNKLNAGILDQLLIEYETIKWDHGVVYLGALAMQLGARITIEQIATLHKTLKRTPMYDEAKAQMQKGLNQYKGDGKPHDFESLGLHDTGAKAMKEDKVTSSKFVLVLRDKVVVCANL